MLASDRTVAVVGGGLSGSLCALKLSRARPDLRVVLIDPAREAGAGLAYGACGSQHLLNVPVNRMEIGLEPDFKTWLSARPAAIADALDEAEGELSAAFVPRALFGAYLKAQVGAAAVAEPGAGLHLVRGEAVAVLDAPRQGVRLADGREIEADAVILATGNMAPRPPGGPDGWFYDRPEFVPDPWAIDAFAGLDPDAPVLLIGAGLTMVDIALRLADAGHRGPMLAVSRHGLLPRAHRGGGAWSMSVATVGAEASPAALLRQVRQAVREAEAQGVPWQRVFDALRPAVPGIWEGWSERQRKQFLRHLRPRWDVHRHRMAPRIAAALQGMIDEGRLETLGARIAGYRLAPGGVEVSLALRGGGRRTFDAARVVNCTGPRSDFDRLGVPLIASLRARGLALADRLGLGLETEDCALRQPSGEASSWLYALGPLTRPAWWEITAVPEIAVQVDGLVERLAAEAGETSVPKARISGAFLDLGAGI